MKNAKITFRTNNDILELCKNNLKDTDLSKFVRIINSEIEEYINEYINECKNYKFLTVSKLPKDKVVIIRLNNEDKLKIDCELSDYSINKSKFYNYFIWKMASK